ncbi:hypothetical protein EVAR_78023_1 [Eumeta japonica]|uniref:Uncharacterized protein n=1 Tax=Eumeta variegata TaxID=151549 RepID=A0A4C1T059_EUMVA|nr:hypothetical protein EVAR_78023_1 [Eumeta japonica]
MTAYRWIAAALVVIILEFSAVRCFNAEGSGRILHVLFDRNAQNEYENRGRGLNDVLFGELIQDIFGDGVSGQIVDYVYRFLTEESDAAGGAWMW